MEKDAGRLAASAQQTGKVPRVGIVRTGAGTFEPESSTIDRAFADGLRERGWIVGQNILIEVRGAQGTPEWLPELARELVRLNVDVIVVPSTLGTLAATLYFLHREPRSIGSL
ncbi:MAG: hypothetical protein ACREMB_15245 [Candidatus Rokuibacteriota bacterium]